MELNEYQKKALETAIYSKEYKIYPALGLTGEAGEVSDKVKNAQMNYEKLSSRKNRGKISGNGDNR